METSVDQDSRESNDNQQKRKDVRLVLNLLALCLGQLMRTAAENKSKYLEFAGPESAIPNASRRMATKYIQLYRKVVDLQKKIEKASHGRKVSVMQDQVKDPKAVAGNVYLAAKCIRCLTSEVNDLKEKLASKANDSGEKITAGNPTAPISKSEEVWDEFTSKRNEEGHVKLAKAIPAIGQVCESNPFKALLSGKVYMNTVEDCVSKLAEDLGPPIDGPTPA